MHCRPTLSQFTSGSCALSSPTNTSAASSSHEEILQKQSLWREKRAACVLFLLLVVLSPFLPPPSSSKFVPFFSNGFVQLLDKSHSPKRQSSFLCMSPWKVLLVVRASQPLFNVKLYSFGGFPDSINPPDGTDTLSGVLRTELINCSLFWYWNLSNETIMLSPESSLCSI